MFQFILLAILLLSSIIYSDDKNVVKDDVKPKFLSKPDYVNDPYLLLMFNGTNDLHHHAEYSDIINKETDSLKYSGKWRIEVTDSTPFKDDYQLVMKSNQSHAAVSFGFNKPFRFESKCLVAQYDFRYPTNHQCGGAYIKLLPERGFNMKKLSNETLYSIMFGPDKCGIDYSIKFIFQYLDPKTNQYIERKQIKDDKRFPRFLGDNITHVITLMICDNNTFQIYRNLRKIADGSLLYDFEPSIGGDKMIVDPNDKKPDGWDQPFEIPDPLAEKPNDWDENEPEFITDLDAKKPKNWLDNEPLMVLSEESKPYNWDDGKNGPWKPPMVKNFKCKVNGCGKWTPPLIRNPKHRGKWTAPLIMNSNYRSEWKPRMIENPNFKKDVDIYKNLMTINSLGLEIWSSTGGIQFDNFLITDNLTIARKFALDTWWPKYFEDTKDQPHYRNIFNDTKPKRKFSIKNYLHWFWATLPLLIGLPILAYVAWLINKKSIRNPDLAKEKCLLKAYHRLKSAGDEHFVSMLSDNKYGNLLMKDALNRNINGDMDNSNDMRLISEEAITQMFGGDDDRVASVLRKRVRESNLVNKTQNPGGDSM